MSDSAIHDPFEGIAVIGMSGRFPGANTIDDFWRNLCDGVESLTFFSDEEMENTGMDPALRQLPNWLKLGRTIDDIEQFDAAFFGYTPREAELMDPQQRLFLECCWESLEQAGYDPETYKGWIGVYGGTALNGYLLYNLFPNPSIREFMETVGAVQGVTANERDYVTTRVSYKLNLRGPSFNVQSACSTSLLAVHLACQSLLNYQCDMALAGGSSVHVPQKSGYMYQEGGMLSPDGRCRTFDAEAKGTVFGSGVGIVLLKRLSDALADGDTIYAVIKGSASNNDGSLKVGFTAPAMEGQAAVIEMAQGLAGIAPETVGYIEAHGTATPLGDPIEVAALSKVFRASTPKKQFCAIGSVKTNIGHASAAAGIIGLIKTVLSLKHKMIPPSLNFNTPNPKIDFANSPFYVNTALAEWQANGTPRRAGVNSFGVGGTNVHAVLEEAPPVEPGGPSWPWQLLVLSARTETALEQTTDNLVVWLKRSPDLDLADIAHTLQVGRRSFNQRRMLVCRDVADAVAALESRDPRRVVSLAREQRDRPVVFMFSGQGAQYVNMARDLYQLGGVFREWVDRCAELLRPHLGIDLRDVIYPTDQDEGPTTDDRRPTTEERDGGRSSVVGGRALNQTQYTQPALFVVEYALAQLWMSWGVRPQAMIGHSIGEYVAACLAGVFSLEDALALVAERGRLMQHMPPGAMLMVPLPEPELLPLLDDQLALAAINSPSRCVVAGPTEAVEALERRLAERGLDCRRLHTSHAFHSRMMEPILEPFTRQVQRVALRAPSIPYISNVSGTWITAAEATDPRYWARHLRQAVRFADGVRTLLQEPDRIMLEVGPGQTLSALARQYPGRAPEQIVLNSVRHPNEQQSDVAFLLNTLGQLWLAGLPIDWPALRAGERRLRVALPTYPFERQRYWIDPPRAEDLARARSESLLKKPDIADWFYIPSWKRSAPPVREPGDLAEAPGWLVFGDAHGLGAKLAQRLEDEGQDVVSVAIGEQFARLGERSYAIDPRRPEDYDALLAELHRPGPPRTIVHLWSVGPDDPALAREARFEQAEDLCFYSLLYLAQALGRQNVTDPLQIWIVSNNMQRVAGEAALAPEKALLLGPCKVIPAEYPNIACHSLDVELPPRGSPAELALLDQLTAELAAGSADDTIAYRGYDRWVHIFEPARLGPADPARSRLREQGVYLITGGLGGIGLALADELARTVRARLVFTGRSVFPQREEWVRWLESHPEQDGVSDKIRKLLALEAAGAEVLVVRADAADEAQMRAAVAQALERFGAIHGVIHAAGLAGRSMIPVKTRQTAARVLAPKFEGLRVLEAVLEDQQLDFMVLCSSIGSVLGGMGRVDYCAANAFLDAHAHYNTARGGTPTIAIDWDAWTEVGMMVNYEAGEAVRGAIAVARSMGWLHPLLEQRLPGPAGREVFLTQLSPAEHWVLSEHRIKDIPTVPGTTYLEMARAAFAQRGAGPVELREVFFLTPMMVGQSERREVHTILEGEGEAAGFRVISRPALPTEGESRWQEHVHGKVARAEAEPPLRYDLEAIRQRCSDREITGRPEDLDERKQLVFWGPRWMSFQQAYIGANEGLALIELPPDYTGDLDQFGLHPALLDVAMSFGNGFASDGDTYLPLSYGRLKVYASLPRRFYTYTRYKADVDAKKETLTFDVTLIDEQGQAIVEIVDFVGRRVHAAAFDAAEASRREQHAAREYGGNGIEEPQVWGGDARALSEGPGRSGAPGTGILTGEGVEAFRRIMARNGLPQVVVSPRDLQMLIERANVGHKRRVLEELDKVQGMKSVHPRPALQSAYTAPRNEQEQRLTEIWQRVLGIEQVGIHDNFFEMGGDSVLVIQIIARAGEIGLQLTPAQLFQYQTIADLVAALGLSPAPAEDQAAEAGPLPLTPVQRWLLEADPAGRGGQTLLLEAHTPLDPALLARATQELLAHHDAFRLRLAPEQAAWLPAGVDAEAAFSTVDLSDARGAEREAAIAAAIAQARTALDPAAGPLARVVLLSSGDGSPDQLLLALPELIADADAWRIVLEDLWVAYTQLGRGEQVALPRAGTFAQWAGRLAERAASSDMAQEQEYWLAAIERPAAPLPADGPNGVEGDAAPHTLTVALGAAETRELLADAHRAYQTQVEDLLLAALVEALAPWTGERALLAELELPARAGLFDDADLSRTVGRLTSVFPARLDLSGAFHPQEQLKAIKEQLRRIPSGGSGHGLLRYLGADAEVAARLSAQLEPELHFGYAGAIEQARPAEERALQIVDSLPDAGRTPRRALDVYARVADGRLQVAWTYDEHTYRRATIERLARDYLAALRELIAHCMSPEAGGYTPSDFPAAELSQTELDKFLTSIGKRSG